MGQILDFATALGRLWRRGSMTGVGVKLTVQETELMLFNCARPRLRVIVASATVDVLHLTTLRGRRSRMSRRQGVARWRESPVLQPR